LVCLTARGRQLEEEVRTHARAAERELARALGKRGFREFRETLVRLIEVCHDDPGKD
jgi:DNA-binding MarR family transcriptional regulator